MSNILFLHSSSDFYGSSKVLIYSVEAAIINGHNPYVLLSEDGPLADYFKEKNIPTIILRLSIIRRKYFNFGGIINRLYYLLKALIKISILVRKYKINIIYSNTTGVLVGCFVAILTNKKHIFHIHEIISSPRILGKLIAFIINKSTNNVIIISKAVANNWVDNGLNEKLINIIYNGQENTECYISKLDIKKELNLSEDTLIISMIGRINLWKGQEYFLRIASEIINSKTKNIHFIYCGDVYPGYEYLYKYLNQLILDLNIESNVTYLGYRKDIKDILSNTDILILPSITPEPFGMVLIEAMERKIAVVATNHGGPTEIIDHNNSGLLIPYDNIKKSAELISELIYNNKKRELIAEKGKQRQLEMFSITQYQKLISNFYN